MIFNGLYKDIETDICIIGTGIGGGTFLEVVSKNYKVTVIEAGDFTVNNGNVSSEMVGREFGLRSTTSIQIGGTSNLWHGVLAPLDKIDFEKRSWIDNSGWPIKFEELDEYYRSAANLLGVNDYDSFFVEKLDNKLKSMCSDLNIKRKYIKNKLFQQPLPPKNFKNSILKICKVSSGIDCYFNSTALKFNIKNGKAIELLVGNNLGEKNIVSAKYFITCSGALETPRLLLNSKINNKNIGRFLMDHPMGNLAQIEFKKSVKLPIYSDIKYWGNCKIKSGIELKDSYQKEFKLPNYNFYLRPSFRKGINNNVEKVKLSLLTFKDGKISFKDIFNLVTNLNLAIQILIYKLTLNVRFKYADLFFVTEQLPNYDSSVLLSEKLDIWGFPISKIDWRISDSDINNIERWHSLLKDIFSENDFIFTTNLKEINWKKNFTSAIHHVGTCRMAISKEEGVVDANLKVFGLDNLYICDGSVFPTAGNVNNGLTIAALAIKLAKLFDK